MSAAVMSRYFERAVLAAIAANTGVLVWSLLDDSHEDLIEPLHTAFLLFFVAEMLARFAGAGFSVRTFVRQSRWNAFDSAVIVLSLLPMLGVSIGVLRLARVARIVHSVRHATHLRLVRFVHA
jgi:hypothetical protein